MTTRRAAALLLVLAGCAGRHYPETPTPWAGEAVYDPARVWQADPGRAVERTPLPVDGDWVVALTDDKAVRLAGTDGHEMWKAKLGSTPAGDPVRSGNRVLLALDQREPRVVALDLGDGREAWSTPLDARNLLVHDGLVVASTISSGVVALRTDDGTEAWAIDLRCGGAGPVPLGSDALVLGVAPDSLVALEAADGTRRWTVRVGFDARPASSAGRLAVATSDSLLVLLDPDTGAVLVRRELDGRAAGSPVWAEGGDRLLLALTDGRLLALDGGDLSPAWTVEFPPPLVCAPLVAGPRVGQSTPRGQLRVLDLHTGKDLGGVVHPERILVTPAYADGDLLVGGSGGTVVLFREGGGAP